MKRYSIQKMLGYGVIALLVTACNDTWNDHYAVDTDMASNSDKTLWQVIQDNDSLAKFANLLEQAGYNDLLSKDRFYTVWAPIGDFPYSGEDAALLEKEFIQNHIANYRHVGVGTLDKNNGVKMLNGKRLIFTGSTGDYRFNGVKVAVTNIPAKNGVLHLIGGNGEYSNFSANIWEYLEKNPQLSKFNAYLKEFTDSTINHSASEAGGSSINDLGQVEYADTVWSVSNPWWNMIGQLNNEDSTYIVIAPTDNAWDKMYEKVSSYLNFVKDDPSIEDPDSIQKMMAEEYMCRHLVFSQTVNPTSGVAGRDSLISNYRVAYNPVVFRGEEYEALFANQVGEPIALSNGTIHIVDQLNYSPTTCWLDTVKIEGENTNYCYEFNNKDGLINDNVSYTVATISRDSAYYEKVSAGSYMLAEERTFSEVKTTYTIPNLYAAKYRIKVVLIPAIYQNPELTNPPTDITLKLSRPGEKDVLTSINYTPKDYDYTKVDTITFIDKETQNDTITIPHCEYSLTLEDTSTELQIIGNKGRSGDEHKKDRTLRIDCIIVEPLE